MSDCHNRYYDMNIDALRGSVRIIHSIQKERLLTCGVMIRNEGDLSSVVLNDEEIKNCKKNNFAYPLLTFCQRHTDRSISRARSKDLSHDSFESFRKIINSVEIARMIIRDGDNIASLKGETEKQTEGRVNVMLTPTYQMGLVQFNAIMENVVREHIFQQYPIVKRNKSFATKNSFLLNASDITETLQSAKKKEESKKRGMDALLESCLAFLNVLSSYASEIFKDGDSRRSQNSDTENHIFCLFLMLVTILRLKEMNQIESTFLLHLLTSGATEADHLEMDINYLVMHMEHQRSVVLTLKKTAQDVDRFSRGSSLLSGLLSDILSQSQKHRELQHLLENDFDLDAFQKSLHVDDFLLLTHVYNDKLHALELAILEEMECITVDKKLQRQNNGTNGNLQGQSGSGIIGGQIKSSFKLSPSQAVVAGMSILSNEKRNSGTIASVSDIRSAIDTLPPEKLKAILLDMIPTESDEASFQAAMNKSGHGREGRMGRRLDNDLNDADELDEDAAKIPSDLLPVVSEWRVELDEIKFKKKIGNGSAGTTYLGRWRREEVAVKVAAATSLGLSGWEADLRALHKLHHPNIIRMLGCVQNETPFALSLLLEYCNLGDLQDALSKPTPSNFFQKVVFGIANGMEYIHNKEMIHRDIKPCNILIHGNLETCDFNVKITDFGLAKICKPSRRSSATSSTAELSEGLVDASLEVDFPEDDQSDCSQSVYDSDEDSTLDQTAEAGTYRWMAPEIIRHEPYGFKVDVYSFAVVMWQLLTREKPFHNVSQEEAAQMVSMGFQRPPFPRGSPRQVVSLIELAWGEDPEERPSFEEICETFEEWDTMLSSREKVWLDSPNGHPVYNRDKEDAGDGGGGRQRSRRGSGIFRSAGNLSRRGSFKGLMKRRNTTLFN